MHGEICTKNHHFSQKRTNFGSFLETVLKKARQRIGLKLFRSNSGIEVGQDQLILTIKSHKTSFFHTLSTQQNRLERWGNN